MIRRSLAACLVASSALYALTAGTGCGSDAVKNPDFGAPPDSGAFNPGPPPGSSGYGSGQPGPGGPLDAGPPVCSDDLKRCAAAFTYPFGGETSVELRGDFDPSAWLTGSAMTHTGSVWKTTVPVPWNKPVQYKFFVDGVWKIDPAQPTITVAGNTNNAATAVTCPSDFTCAQPPVPPPGVYDWRDAVIYFAFVDRFLDGNSGNDCNVAGTDSAGNYKGGDWAGITQKINAGYFNDLGVNTLWITVPIKNADDVAGHGVNGDTHNYSAYHGYWPGDPTQTESCFGSAADLKALVDAAHTKKLKVLFDYAMVHAHTSSSIYTQHKNDSPSWFTPSCICGASGCGNFDTSCWFTDYLAHYDYTNAATRSFSVNAAIGLITQSGNDAFRLDAIKQVDPSWLAALRPAIATQILAKQTPSQRFYMVGETYDFQNRALIKSMVDPSTKLDGQFDFPLRIRLIEAVLMRSTGNLLTLDDTNWSRNARSGMAGLSDFMDANEDYYGTGSVMSTFIGNHDLPRSIHYAEDAPLWSNSAADGKDLAWAGSPSLSTNAKAYERLANAFAVLLTNKGAPLIYYGDEVGLPGAGDPDNRRMMQWTGYTTNQQALYARIKAMTAIRAAHPALRRGKRTTSTADADLWVFKMATASESPADVVYVAINRSDSDRTTTDVPAGTPELLTGAASTATTTIPARQTRIFSQPFVAASPDAGADGG